MKKVSWKVLVVFFVSAMAGSLVFVRQRALSFVVSSEVAELSAVGIASLDPELIRQKSQESEVLGRASLRRNSSFDVESDELDNANEDSSNSSLTVEDADADSAIGPGSLIWHPVRKVRAGDIPVPPKKSTAELDSAASSSLDSSKGRLPSHSVFVADDQASWQESDSEKKSHSIKELLAALDEGTPDSLAIVATEELISYPDYYTAILPAIKERALRNLVAKLESVDWEGWKQLSAEDIKGVNKGRHLASDAKEYLAILYRENGEVGIFLDETTFVLHKLYQSVQRGEVFDLEKDLPNLINEAPDAEGERQADIMRELGMNEKFVNAMSKQVPFLRLNKDPIFVKAFDKVNAVLVEDHFMFPPTGKALGRVLLIGSVRPDLASKGLQMGLADELRDLSFANSADDRLELFLNEYKKGVLARYAATNARVRVVLANLYTIGAVDALDSGNRELAEVLYGMSLRTQPGLSAQNQLSIALYGRNHNAPKDNSLMPQRSL